MNSHDKTLQDRTKTKNTELSFKDLIGTYFSNGNNYNSFKELINTYITWRDANDGDDDALSVLLDEGDLFEALIQNNILTQEDLNYLLNRINSTFYELSSLCTNTSLTKHILNEFLLDKENIDRFSTMIENDDWCEDHNIHTIFDYIEYKNKNNEEILKLNDLNRKVYRLNDSNLTTDEKLELVDVLRDNKQAQSLLKQIVDNHLEDTYDFEMLKSLLTKDEEKKKIKLNL